MSALASPGNTSDRAYHSEPKFEKRTYTLLEKIEMVTRGILTPIEIYRQMPESMQKEVDALANLRTNSSFSNLSIVDQSTVFQKLKSKIESCKQFDSVIKQESRSQSNSPGQNLHSRTNSPKKTETSPSSHSYKKYNFFRKFINSIYQR